MQTVYEAAGGTAGLTRLAAAWHERVLAVIGTLLILFGVITRFAFHWLSERYFGVLRSEVIVSILSADLVAGGVVTGVGLLLITRALMVAS
jgi:hypothetical protein